jgi:hypothetical protein
LIVSIGNLSPGEQKSLQANPIVQESEMKKSGEFEVVKSRQKSLRTTRATERKLKGRTRQVLAA